MIDAKLSKSKNRSKNSQSSGFAVIIYRFLWRHRVFLIKLIFSLIKIIFGNDNSE